MFKVGDEVVCVNAEWDEPCWPGYPLREGAVYVVNGLCHHNCRGKHVPCLILCGVEHCYPPWKGFAALRFRKVQKRTTEVGMAILHRIRKEAGERVH